MRTALCAWIWFSTNLAMAETLYVAPNGNDANPGTAEKPIQTPQGAAALLQQRPGITEIVFRGGTYPGGMSFRGPEGADPKTLPTLTIRAVEGEEVFFDGARKIDSADAVEGRPGVFRIPFQFSPHRPPQMWELDSRTRYVPVADLQTVAAAAGTFTYDEKTLTFHTTDGKAPGEHQIGLSQGEVGIFPQRPNTVIEGITFKSFIAWQWSSAVDFRAENIVVRKCRAWNCYRGFLVSQFGINCRLENCRTDDCGGGVYVNGTNTEVLEGQFFKVRDAFMVPTYPQDDTGIQFYHPSQDGVVRGNLVKGFRNGIFLKTPGVYTVEHNTVLDGEWGLYRSGWGPGNKYVRNIIVRFSQPFLDALDIQPGCEVDTNCIWEPQEKELFEQSVEGPVRAGTGRHNFLGDPRFAAPEAGDYRLLPDSPCVALASGGRPLGALGAVPADFKDVQAPNVRLELRSPAAKTGAFGELFFEKDPWLGGGRTLVKPLHRQEAEADTITKDPNLNLDIIARDAASRPDKMRLKVGDADWGTEEAFAPRKLLALSDKDGVHLVEVKVSDSAGNWSEPATLRVRLSRKAPEISGSVHQYVNGRGAILSFRTAQPAFAKIEFGPEKSYGSIQEEAQYVERRWESNDGGDWVSEWREPRLQHHIALIWSATETGKANHWRIVVRDAVGNESASGDATLTLAGSPRALHVAPGGKDEDGRGGPDAPFATLQFAVDRALPGDRVLLAPGIYLDETYFSHGGVEGAPIVIEAEKPGTVILDGVRKAASLLRLERAPYVTVRNIEMRWYSGAGNGVYLADSPGFTIEGCKIWNDFWTGWPEGYGVFAHRSPGVTAERNLLLRQESGIYLLQCPRSRLVNNTACSNLYGAAHIIFSATETVLRNNSFCFNGNDQYVIEAFDRSELDSFDSDFNNLGTVLRDGTPEPDQVEKPADFRLLTGSKAIIGYSSQRFYNLKSWRDFSGKDQHSIFANPQYVNPIGHDFRVKAGSANLGAGEKGATIGAFGAKE